MHTTTNIINTQKKFIAPEMVKNNGILDSMGHSLRFRRPMTNMTIGKAKKIQLHTLKHVRNMIELTAERKDSVTPPCL